ncbi:HNH endonuclease signature motif containing protein [Georgenia sp. SYP-B2076]|uniref:HNH endonuclease signature motif containing protein n=1 Tax=Georgenia sp. SYP-B2076 TaxID=2495881 RepID=UPI000F8CD726|nr:HNH endonuclease signature motif containing protein [Georgenia sp. SYP-B2076]
MFDMVWNPGPQDDAAEAPPAEAGERPSPLEVLMLTALHRHSVDHPGKRHHGARRARTVRPEPPEVVAAPETPTAPAEPEPPTAPVAATSPTPLADPASLGDILDSAAPLVGLDLAQTIDGVDPEGQDAGDLVELIAHWSRLLAWAHARRGEAAAELLERASRDHTADTALLVVATEVAMRQGTSRQAASTLVRTGSLLAGPLMATGEALRRGAIDPGKAQIIAKALEDLPLPVSTAVEDVVLPGALGRTHRQLTRDLSRALIAVDHHEAERRHRSARDKRRVCHPRALPDGMASMFAVLPAEDAIALDLALDAGARSAKNAGDRRTSDQLRADILAAVGADALVQGWIGGRPGTVVAADPAPGAAADPADRPDASGPRPKRRPAPAETFPIGTVGGVPVQVNVTVPLSTLMGGGEPGDLHGYGPIDPASARALALGGVWRRLVTDPLSGTVLDVGRTRYRVPLGLAEIVRARDGTCVLPGCGTPASRCDLDHTIPFGRGGPTALTNLGAACDTDHLIKTMGDFRVRQFAHGVFEWTSRLTGRTYRRELDGSTTVLPWRASKRDAEPVPPPADRSGSADDGEGEGDDDAPPF